MLKRQRRRRFFFFFSSLLCLLWDSVCPPLTMTHHLELSPVEVSGYSHTAVCLLADAMALLGPIGSSLTGTPLLTSVEGDAVSLIDISPPSCSSSSNYHLPTSPQSQFHVFSPPHRTCLYTRVSFGSICFVLFQSTTYLDKCKLVLVCPYGSPCS